MSMLAAVSDVEAVVNRTVSATDEPRVLRLIEMVSAQVTRYTGQSFVHVTDDSVIVHPHDGELRLPQHPVTGVTSVTVGTTTVASTAYEVHSNGYVRRTLPFILVPDSQFGVNGITQQNGMQWPIDGEFGWPPFPTTVVYSHGYSDPDDYADVSMVVAEVVAEKWLAGGNNATNLTGVQVDTYAEHYNKAAKLGAWSQEHKAVLDRFRRAGLASVRLG